MPIRIRHACALLLTLIVAIGLSACGTTEEPRPPADEGGDSAGTGSVTVTDSRGREVVLDGPAKDVVSLEWSAAEDLVTLGVMPVGVAEADNYGTWVSAAPLDDSVTDVGSRNEPSIDAIVQLAPDLVIADEENPALISQLEQYVPVLAIRGSDVSDNIGQMRENFTMVATATGTQDKAPAVLDEFDAGLAEAAAKLEAAGAAGTEIAIADGWMAGSTVSMRLFGKGSLLSDLAEEIGLVNAWDGQGDPTWGLGETDVEGLTSLGDVEFFYSASEQDVFAEGLADNAIWNSLPFVQSGAVHRLDPGTWTFGGPRSSMAFVDQVVDALTRQ